VPATLVLRQAGRGAALGAAHRPLSAAFELEPSHPRSIELQGSAVQPFGSLDLDQHRMPLLLRITVLFGLDQATPYLFVDRSRAVDLRPAIKSGDATLRQYAFLAQLRLAEIDR